MINEACSFVEIIINSGAQFLAGLFLGAIIGGFVVGFCVLWFAKQWKEDAQILRKNDYKLRKSFLNEKSELNKEIQALKKEISELKISNTFSEYYAGRDKK